MAKKVKPFKLAFALAKISDRRFMISMKFDGVEKVLGEFSFAELVFFVEAIEENPRKIYRIYKLLGKGNHSCSIPFNVEGYYSIDIEAIGSLD